MRGLPQRLLSALRQALMRCNEFQSTPLLRAVFAAEELQIWQASLPEADNLQSRVDLTLDYLREKRRRSGEHALVLLLNVLSSRYDPADERHGLLADLATQLWACLDTHSASADIPDRDGGKVSSPPSTRLRRLEQQRDVLQQELELRLEKLGRIRKALEDV